MSTPDRSIIDTSSLLRKAQLDTVFDCIELLIKLRDGEKLKDGSINDMVNRLANMARSL
jgi:hypothetical protein